MTTNRRAFIIKSAIAISGLTVGLNTVSQAKSLQNTGKLVNMGPSKISVFSKNLHWLNYRDMAVTAAEMGFDGIDLTVRPGGHVSPERVDEDLPKAVEEIRKVGLTVDMITTAIGNVSDAHTETVLKVASSLGIANYRLGWFKYDENLTMIQNLEDFKKRLGDLQALNEQYKIHGDYQNHAGSGFGSTVVDLWYVLKDLNPRWIGCQYDIRHATVEGANSWPIGLKLLANHIKTINIKDYKWTFTNGKWQTENVPLGEGMVNFKEYFTLLDQNRYQGPICVHYEYPLGGAESGARELSVASDKVLNSMKKDLVLLKSWLGK